MNQTTSTRVAVVGGARTPFVKAGTAFKRHSALDLAIHSVDGLLEKQNVDPALIDELMVKEWKVPREEQDEIA